MVTASLRTGLERRFLAPATCRPATGVSILSPTHATGGSSRSRDTRETFRLNLHEQTPVMTVDDALMVNCVGDEETTFVVAYLLAKRWA